MICELSFFFILLYTIKKPDKKTKKKNLSHILLTLVNISHILLLDVNINDIIFWGKWLFHTENFLQN